MPTPRTPRLHRELGELLATRLHAHSEAMLEKLDAQAARFEMRYQTVAAKFYHAQEAFQQAQRETIRLREVVQAKQEFIEVLLPYYPHPLTREQHRTLALK